MFPWYLSIGVTPQEFWEGDPYLVVHYRKAHLLKIEQRNQELWMQGLYIYNAVDTAVYNNLRMFSKHKPKAHKYLEQPIRITPMSEAEKKAEQEKNVQKVVEYLEKMQKQWESKNKGKVGANGIDSRQPDDRDRGNGLGCVVGDRCADEIAEKSEKCDEHQESGQTQE